MSATAEQPQSVVTRFRAWTTWTGRVITVLPVFILLSSARWKLTHNPWYVAEWGSRTPSSCR